MEWIRLQTVAQKIRPNDWDPKLGAQILLLKNKSPRPPKNLAILFK